jgi:hypothetical protein
LPVICNEQGRLLLAAADFVDAFKNLDWDRFEASWAQDATVFFPMDWQTNNRFLPGVRTSG